MAAIFSKDEVATRSLTSSSSNFQKGQENAKKGLDAGVRDALIDFALEQFGFPKSMALSDTGKGKYRYQLKIVRAAMTTKLNNEARVRRHKLLQEARRAAAKLQPAAPAAAAATAAEQPEQNAAAGGDTIAPGGL